MAAYDQVLTDSTGAPVLTTYTGTPVTGSSAVKLAVTGGIDPSSLVGQAITGQGIPANTEITGFISSDVTGVTYSIGNPIQPSTPSIAVTLPNKVTTQPGLVVGLSDGSVYYWNGTGCMSTKCVGPVVVPADSSTVVGGVNSPVSMAMARDGQVYALGDDLTVIDSATNTITATLPIAWYKGYTFPSVVVSRNGFYAYATEALPNDTAGVAVIDTASNTVTATITLPNQATAQTPLPSARTAPSATSRTALTSA